MIKYSKAILGNSDLTSAQAFIYLTNNLNLFCLISAQGEDIFTKIRQIGGELEVKFFELEVDTSKRILDCLEFIKHDLEGSENLQILLATSQEDVLYLQKEGNSEAYLFRDGEIILLSASSQLISGHIKKGDKLLFLTESLASAIGQEQIKKLSLSTLEEFEDEVDSYSKKNFVYSLNLPSPLPVAAMLIDYHSDEVDKPLLEYKRELNKLRLPNFAVPPILKSRRLKLAAIFLVALALLFLGGLLIKNLLFSNSKIPQEKNVEQEIKKENLEDTKTYQESSFENYLSLDLIKEGFSAKKLSFSLGKLLILDEAKKTLVYLDLENKSHQILAGEDQLGNAKLASLNGDFAFVYSENKGIVRIDIKDGKPKVVVKPDEDWGRISDLYGFANNIYLLDSLKNQIWKYVPIPSGYSDKFSYLKEGARLPDGQVKVDLLDTKRVQIDSSIWVLKQGPKILKFTQGVEDHFSISGLEQPLKELTSFFVSENGDFIYFIDPENQRLVVVRKSGEYEAQYIGEKFKNASDLVVDEKSKKIYLLEGNSIYQVELR